MSRWIFNLALAILALTVSLAGCGGSFDIYSPGQIHRTVRSQGPGLYVVSYKWPYVEDHFGKDRATAVPEYLKMKGLVPPECTQGVTVIRGGEVEGGGGWAEFRCKE